MRDYSTGGVRKRGGHWQAFTSYQDENGRQRFVTRMTGVPCKAGKDDNAGKQAALKVQAKWRAELVEQAEREDGRPTYDPGQTVSAYVASYIEGCKVHAEPSTISGYQTILKNQIAAYPIAGVRLDDLTPADVRAWLASLTEDYGTSVIRKAFNIVRAAMKQAVTDKRLLANPTDGVKPPKPKAPSPNAIEEKQRGLLTETLARAEQTPEIIGMRLALYTGMREGEICALRWRNVHVEDLTLDVREAVGRTNGGCYVKEPKNGGSRRTVCYPSVIGDMLRSRRIEMMEQCMAAGIPLSPDMFVLGSIDKDERTGDYRFLSPNTLWKKWRALADLLGIVGTQGRRATFHDLRHTFATTAIAEHVDVKTVASNLGHANAAMTLNIYADADPDAKRRAADVIGKAMERGAKGPAIVLPLRTGTDDR